MVLLAVYVDLCLLGFLSVLGDELDQPEIRKIAGHHVLFVPILLSQGTQYKPM